MLDHAQPLDRRIDLDGVHVPRPPRERTADVVARAGADHEHVIERRAAGVAPKQMRQRIGRRRIRPVVAGHHLLMAEQVHGDEPIVPSVVDPVVGRPLGVAEGRPRGGHEHEQQTRRRRDAHASARRAVAPEQEIAEHQDDRHEPADRRQLQPRAHREQDDASEAADDVQRVGPQAPRHAAKRPPQLLPRPDHRQRHHQEEESGDGLDGNQKPGRVARRILRAEEDELR